MASTVASDAERIDALEMRVAFQDDTITQLNDALVAQQDRLDGLQEELQQLAASMVDGGDAPMAPDEPPPHY